MQRRARAKCEADGTMPLRRLIPDPLLPSCLATARGPGILSPKKEQSRHEALRLVLSKDRHVLEESLAVRLNLQKPPLL